MYVISQILAHSKEKVKSDSGYKDMIFVLSISSSVGVL